MKEFIHICPGCQSNLKALYHFNKDELVIDLVDEDFNLKHYCANCMYKFTDKKIDQLAEKIEKQIESDNITGGD